MDRTVWRTRVGDWLLGKSLAYQFVVVGGFVSVLAMLLVGAVVTTLIERAVMRHFGATTALYVDSVIAPLLPDMRSTEALDPSVGRALDETLGQGALGERLVAMRLWAPDGTILYASEDHLVGRTYPVTPDMQEAFAGRMVVEYERFDVLDETAPIPEGPLLEIYNPILQPWSGEVVAVMEFYEHADDFRDSLWSARVRSWLAVAAVTLLFFLALTAIVTRGSRTIDRQARDLAQRVAELTTLLAQNHALHERVRVAARRTTEMNESYLRRLGADLHDGPVQLVALASLRLDSEAVIGSRTPKAKRAAEIASIQENLREALNEIRSLCHGLVLPDIETSSLSTLAERAIESHERRTGRRVRRTIRDDDVVLGMSQRICVYRFLQEALNNSFRHAGGSEVSVALDAARDRVAVSVSDNGSGFDPASVPGHRIGLAGLRDRVESLGGTFALRTGAHGTVLTMTLEPNGPPDP